MAQAALMVAAVMAVANYQQLPYLFGVNHCVETVKDGIPLRGLAFLDDESPEMTKA